MPVRSSPPCPDCGHRHGAPGRNKTCKLRVPGEGGSRKSAADAARRQHVAGLSLANFVVTADYVAGGATNRGNNCLIRTRIELRMADVPGGESVETALDVGG